MLTTDQRNEMRRCIGGPEEVGGVFNQIGRLHGAANEIKQTDMRRTEFKVIFNTGREEVYYCASFEQCILIAMTDSLNKGWSPKIDRIYDEKGRIASNIKQPTFSIEP